MPARLGVLHAAVEDQQARGPGATAQAAGGLQREAAGGEARGLGAAGLRREDVAVADGARLGGLLGQVEAVEAVPESVAIAPAPGMPRVAGAAGAELFDGGDAVAGEAGGHLLADAGDVLEL